MYYETVKKSWSSIINFFNASFASLTSSSTKTNETLDKIKWIFGGNISTNETNPICIGSQYVQKPNKDMWRDPWVEL